VDGRTYCLYLQGRNSEYKVRHTPHYTASHAEDSNLHSHGRQDLRFCIDPIFTKQLSVVVDLYLGGCQFELGRVTEYSELNSLVFFSLCKRMALFSVSQEERSIFWEVIISVILSKKVYMYMHPIPNGFRDRAISLYSSKTVDKKEILRTVSNTPHDLAGRDPGPPRWEASDQPLELWHGLG
jgi:hypothetical protein